MHQIALIAVVLIAEISITATAFLALKAGGTTWLERAMAATALLVSLAAILLVSLFAYGLTTYIPQT